MNDTRNVIAAVAPLDVTAATAALEALQSRELIDKFMIEPNAAGPWSHTVTMWAVEPYEHSLEKNLRDEVRDLPALVRVRMKVRIDRP